MEQFGAVLDLDWIIGMTHSKNQVKSVGMWLGFLLIAGDKIG